MSRIAEAGAGASGVGRDADHMGESRELAPLVARLGEQALLHVEERLDLLQSELGVEMRRVRGGLVRLGVGAVLGSAAIQLVAAAAAIALMPLLPLWASLFTLGLLCLAGALLFVVGAPSHAGHAGAFAHTLAELRKDRAWIAKHAAALKQDRAATTSSSH